MIGQKRDAECDEHGGYTSYFIKVGGGRWTGCPICAEKLVEESNAKQQEAAAEQMREARARARIAQTGLPRRLQGATFSSYRFEPGTQQEDTLGVVWSYAQAMEDNLKTGESLILMGNMGNGKTHLACAVIDHVIKNHDVSALYMTAPSLFTAIKESYRGDGESEADIINRLASVPLLVLDEIGIGKGSDHELGILYQVLGRRYDECLPTILATNLGGKDFRAWMGDRLADRLRETCRVALFNWESNRSRT